MKKTDCSVIKDLLPLYIDDVCGAESKELVAEHLKQCKECTAEKVKMAGEIELPKDTGLKALMNIQITISKRVKHRFAILGSILWGVIIGVVAGVFLTSYQIPVAFEDLDGSFHIYNQGHDVTIYAQMNDYYRLFGSEPEYLGDDEDGVSMYAVYYGYSTTPIIELRKNLDSLFSVFGIDDLRIGRDQFNWIQSTQNGVPEEDLPHWDWRMRITKIYYLPMNNNRPVPADKSDAVLIWSEEGYVAE